MTSKEYFSDLNYTMANEDTAVEYNILQDESFEFHLKDHTGI